MIPYMARAFKTESEKADCFLGFLIQAECLAIRTRVVDFSGPRGHPCSLQVLGLSDQADLLYKGSRAKGWSQVVAQNLNREEKDQAQAP